MTVTPRIMKHLHYAQIANDVEQTQQWYADVMGAELPQPERGYPPRIRLAGTTIDLFPAGATTPAGLPLGAPMPGSIGQHHAYEIDLEAYDVWIKHLEAMGQRYRCAAHGTRYMSIYVDDIDGYHIELTVPFDDEKQGRAEMEKRGLVPAYMG